MSSAVEKDTYALARRSDAVTQQEQPTRDEILRAHRAIRHALAIASAIAIAAAVLSSLVWDEASVAVAAALLVVYFVTVVFALRYASRRRDELLKEREQQIAGLSPSGQDA